MGAQAPPGYPERSTLLSEFFTLIGYPLKYRGRGSEKGRHKAAERRRGWHRKIVKSGRGNRKSVEKAKLNMPETNDTGNLEGTPGDEKVKGEGDGGQAGEVVDGSECLNGTEQGGTGKDCPKEEAKKGDEKDNQKQVVGKPEPGEGGKKDAPGEENQKVNGQGGQVEDDGKGGEQKSSYRIKKKKKVKVKKTTDGKEPESIKTKDKANADGGAKKKNTEVLQNDTGGEASSKKKVKDDSCDDESSNKAPSGDQVHKKRTKDKKKGRKDQGMTGRLSTCNKKGDGGAMKGGPGSETSTGTDSSIQTKGSKGTEKDSSKQKTGQKQKKHGRAEGDTKHGPTQDQLWINSPPNRPFQTKPSRTPPRINAIEYFEKYLDQTPARDSREEYSKNRKGTQPIETDVHKPRQPYLQNQLRRTRVAKGYSMSPSYDYSGTSHGSSSSSSSSEYSLSSEADERHHAHRRRRIGSKGRQRGGRGGRYKQRRPYTTQMTAKRKFVPEPMAEEPFEGHHPWYYRKSHERPSNEYADSSSSEENRDSSKPSSSSSSSSSGESSRSSSSSSSSSESTPKRHHNRHRNSNRLHNYQRL